MDKRTNKQAEGGNAMDKLISQLKLENAIRDYAKSNKNADCSTILICPPSPSSRAIFTASMV